MPVVRAHQAPQFQLPGVTFTGLAAPSRGSSESCAWRVLIAPGTPGTAHVLDREEIFVALSGHALATVGTEQWQLGPGDTLIVPADQAFSLANNGTEPFDAIALAPQGVQVRMIPGDATFAPPWTQ
ncbi:MAG: cupin domain-containing protein [Betaproteobacteria bacterium]